MGRIFPPQRKNPHRICEGFRDNKLWQLPTLPRHADAVPSAMAGLTTLFGMGRGGDTAGKTTIRSWGSWLPGEEPGAPGFPLSRVDILKTRAEGEPVEGFKKAVFCCWKKLNRKGATALNR